MFSKFMNLEPEKRERILNAAMKEFAQKGFKNASTNEIVQGADIAKGLLFHYFKNKKQLFLFLYDYCIDICMNEFYKKIDLKEEDFFIRFRQAQFIKMELLKKYPEIFNFLQVAYVENSSDIKSELDSRNQELLLSASNKIFEGIDISRFKEDTDLKKVMNIIVWTFQGFADEFLKKSKLQVSGKVEYEKAFAEADDYLTILRNCFYR